MRFNLSAGFPMLTTKRLPLKAIVPVLWFLAMIPTSTSQDNGVSIWDDVDAIWACLRIAMRSPAPDGRSIDQISTSST
jgi:thymidylate synthase